MAVRQQRRISQQQSKGKPNSNSLISNERTINVCTIIVNWIMPRRLTWTDRYSDKKDECLYRYRVDHEPIEYSPIYKLKKREKKELGTEYRTFAGMSIVPREKDGDSYDHLDRGMNVGYGLRSPESYDHVRHLEGLTEKFDWEVHFKGGHSSEHRYHFTVFPWGTISFETMEDVFDILSCSRKEKDEISLLDASPTELSDKTMLLIDEVVREARNASRHGLAELYGLLKSSNLRFGPNGSFVGYEKPANDALQFLDSEILEGIESEAEKLRGKMALKVQEKRLIR